MASSASSASRGSRITSSRRILLEVLFGADGHMSAEDAGPSRPEEGT